MFHKPDLDHVATLVAEESIENVSLGILVSQIKLYSKSKEEGDFALPILSGLRGMIVTITQVIAQVASRDNFALGNLAILKSRGFSFVE